MMIFGKTPKPTDGESGAMATMGVDLTGWQSSLHLAQGRQRLSRWRTVPQLRRREGQRGLREGNQARFS